MFTSSETALISSQAKSDIEYGVVEFLILISSHKFHLSSDVHPYVK